MMNRIVVDGTSGRRRKLLARQNCEKKKEAQKDWRSFHHVGALYRHVHTKRFIFYWFQSHTVFFLLGMHCTVLYCTSYVVASVCILYSVCSILVPGTVFFLLGILNRIWISSSIVITGTAFILRWCRRLFWVREDDRSEEVYLVSHRLV
jgi:hypothetical protein